MIYVEPSFSFPSLKVNPFNKKKKKKKYKMIILGSAVNLRLTPRISNKRAIVVLIVNNIELFIILWIFVIKFCVDEWRNESKTEAY